MDLTDASIDKANEKLQKPRSLRGAWRHQRVREEESDPWTHFYEGYVILDTEQGTLFLRKDIIGTEEDLEKKTRQWINDVQALLGSSRFVYLPQQQPKRKKS